MECISFTRFFMAVSLILIYVIQKLVGLAHQASPTNLKPKLDDMFTGNMDVRHLSFEDQLQFIDSSDYGSIDRLTTSLNDLDARNYPYQRCHNNNNNNNNKNNELHHHRHKHQHQQINNNNNHHNQNKYSQQRQQDNKLDRSHNQEDNIEARISVEYLSFSVFSFELNERQGCLGTGNYTVMRTFLAINTGQMVMRVRGFRIGSSTTTEETSSSSDYANDSGSSSATSTAAQHSSDQRNLCHGYGFTIYDCEPFDLKPRHAHEIRIAFTPDFTLTNTIVSLTIFTNVSEGFRYALMATVPRNLLVSCNHSLPRPEWERTMHCILAIGMVIMISCSIVIAYLEAKLYLKRGRLGNHHSSAYAVSSMSNNHNGNENSQQNNNRGHDRSHCSTHGDIGDKDRGNGSGHGAAAISTSSSSTSNGQVSRRSGNRKGSVNDRLLNSSLNKSGGSSSDRKTKSDFSNGPIFQNLTNVIASPPPPLPSFDCEFDELDFKKSKSAKKSSKKSNSLSGSIAGNDDTSSNGSQTNSKPGKNNKNNCQSQSQKAGARDGKSSNRSANQSPFPQQGGANDMMNKVGESQQSQSPINFNNFKSITTNNQASRSSRFYSNGHSSSGVNGIQSQNDSMSTSGSKYWSNDMARFTGLVETNSSVPPPTTTIYGPATVPTTCSSVLENELDHLRATSSPWNSSLSAVEHIHEIPTSSIASIAPLRPCHESFTLVNNDVTRSSPSDPRLVGYTGNLSVPSGLASSPARDGPTASDAPTDQFNLFGPDSGPNWIGWVSRQKT